MSTNPILPYPGRQIFVGNNAEGMPAFGYLVTGRSAPSRERRAVYRPEENAVRIVPLDPNAPFDELRHYQAVRIDPKTKLVVVSNSQAPVDGLLHSYNAIIAAEGFDSDVVEALLRLLGPEPDPSATPRIVAVIAAPQDQKSRYALGAFGIATQDDTATERIATGGDIFYTFSTYSGSVEDPLVSFDVARLGKVYTELSGIEPRELAEELYETSYQDNPRGDLRVCTVAGVWSGSDWGLHIKNRFE